MLLQCKWTGITRREWQNCFLQALCSRVGICTWKTHTSPGGHCQASLWPARCPLCPRQGSEPGGDAWAVIAERKDGELFPSQRTAGCDRHPGRHRRLVSRERESPLLGGAHTAAWTPVCCCRVVALGLLRAGCLGSQRRRVSVTGPCHSFGQHR